jgi:hypothetical protein
VPRGGAEIAAGKGGSISVDSAVLGWLGVALRALGPRSPSTAFIDPRLEIETWDVVSDGTHNSNTDLIYLNGSFYLVHQTSPSHLGSQQSRLVVRKSRDARSWEKAAELKVGRGELRDPKFASIGRRLFLYALRNKAWTAEPYTTVYTFSEDANTWAPLVEAQPEGWLFWRPKTLDSATWYAPAYWHEHGSSILLKSTDGINWSAVSTIYEGERNDETAVEFLPDGRIIATARLEGSSRVFGDPNACTLIATASPPYVNWSYAKSRVTRLDGPCLFRHDGQVFAVGRYQPQRARPFWHTGSIFSKKRTSLFVVTEDSLVYLADLPSAGDTSYAGAVLLEDGVYISYYTSPTDRDLPWITGMLTQTDIMMAKISLASLAAVAVSPQGIEDGT